MPMEQGFCPLIKDKCQGVVCNFYLMGKYVEVEGCLIVEYLKEMIE